MYMDTVFLLFFIIAIFFFFNYIFSCNGRIEYFDGVENAAPNVEEGEQLRAWEQWGVK